MELLKEEKEAFVSGLTGTSTAETYLLTLTLLCGYLLRCCCLLCVPALSLLASCNDLVGFAVEYLTVILPAILIFTVVADHAVYVLLAEVAVCCFLIVGRLSNSPKTVSLKDALAFSYPARFPYITVMRTFVNLFTAIAILAVDFPIYPRRLAKAETYGSGLMDVGVGAFLMAHGLTSPEARESRPPAAREKGHGHLVWVTLKQVLPLLVLGLVRLLSVKATDYQEHVTEYGVHWNFFFTIAAVRVLCSLLRPLLSSLPYGYGLVAMAVATLYQLLLQWGGLESYVLLGPSGDGSRVGVVSANREGIVSCVGYLAIYTGWIQLGRWLLRPRRVLRDFLKVFVVLVAMFLGLWVATEVCQQHVQPISRRLVNLPYILWIFSYGALTLSATLFIDLVTLSLADTTHAPRPPPYAPPTDGKIETPHLCIASAIDYNQLMFFVLANVLTGVVNFSMDTLHAGSGTALTVLLTYMATLAALFLALHRHKVKIKV